MAQYRSPAPINFEEPKWDHWKSQFLTFRKVTKLHTDEEDVQVASLKYCMGPEAEEIMATFGLNSTDEKKFDVVLKKFDEYFKPKVNVIRLRRLFQRRMQLTTENEESYLRTLYNAAQDCDFGTLKRERIRDQFIAGILDEKLAEKLEHAYMNNRENFTLDFVVEYTRTYCDVKEGRKQERDAMKESNIPYEISEVRNSYDNRAGNCKYCGQTHVFGKCPAYGKRYTACNKLHHYARVCRGNPRAGYFPAREWKQRSSNTARVYTVNAMTDHHCQDSAGSDSYNRMPQEDHLFLGECHIPVNSSLLRQC